jgi:hypothetical protein
LNRITTNCIDRGKFGRPDYTRLGSDLIHRYQSQATNALLVLGAAAALVRGTLLASSERIQVHLARHLP